MEQQKENKSGEDQKNENKSEENQQSENEELKSLEDVGKSKPIFNIIRRGEDPVEVKAKSRINLAISLSKFRINYLFHFGKINLYGDIYQKDYFQFFLDIACSTDDKFENDERFLQYSPYLYAYSDIWGFDELKQKIDKLWQNHPGFLKMNENEEKNEKDINKSFIDNLISYIEQMNSNFTSSNEPITDIKPAKYFEENINAVLKDAKINNFMNVSPRILNVIIQSIPKEKLDGKIYFDFLMEYIKEANENNKNLLLYEPLISYIDFDALEYDNIEKFVNLDFPKTKSKHNNSDISISDTEKQKEEKKDEAQTNEEVQTSSLSIEEEEEEEAEEEEEEEEEEKEGEYFDFLTFTQFKSFARKLVDENNRYKKEIENLRKSIDDLNKKYAENEENLSKCFMDQQSELDKNTDERAKKIEDSINSNKERIETIAKNNKNMDKIIKDIDTNFANYDIILKDLENTKGDAKTMKYNYNISSYIISAINRQFIPINRSEKSIMKIYKDIDGIKCYADLNNQNDIDNISFDFTSIKDENKNPIIYLRPNSNSKPQPNQNENENDIFVDFMVREYEIEVEDGDYQQLLSWEIEGFFPKDFNSYKEYKDNENISDDQWFPISIHSAADAIIYDDKYKSNQQFDTLFTDNNYKIYKFHMGYSPICKCIRFKMIRNSSDTNILKISRLQLTGQVLQPFQQ